MRAISLILLLILIVGCQAASILHTETTTRPDGTVIATETVVRAPRDNVEPAHFVRRDEGGFGTEASTGARQGTDHALAQLGAYAIPAGIGFVLFGGLCLAVSMGLANIPLLGRIGRGWSVTLIGVGLLLIATPMLLDRYLWLIAGGMAVLAVAGAVSWMHNGKLLPRLPEPKQVPA